MAAGPTVYPPDWVAAAQQHASQPPSTTTATSLLHTHLGWQPAGSEPFPLADFTVSRGTQLLGG
jgi:hypothetical protein